MDLLLWLLVELSVVSGSVYYRGCIVIVHCVVAKFYSHSTIVPIYQSEVSPPNHVGLDHILVAKMNTDYCRA